MGVGARLPPRSSIREGQLEPAQDWTAQPSGRPPPTGHWASHSSSLDGPGAPFRPLSLNQQSEGNALCPDPKTGRPPSLSQRGLEAGVGAVAPQNKGFELMLF